MIEDYVSKDLLKRAGFYPAPNFGGQSNYQEETFWYLGCFKEKSMVVLIDYKKKGKETIWYFNSFENVPSIKKLCENVSLLGQFFVRIRESHTENHKIAPEDLEKAIELALAA